MKELEEVLFFRNVLKVYLKKTILSGERAREALVSDKFPFFYPKISFNQSNKKKNVLFALEVR